MSRYTNTMIGGYRDQRNPYGARGGYVDNRDYNRGGRDYTDYRDYNDYATNDYDMGYRPQDYYDGRNRGYSGYYGNTPFEMMERDFHMEPGMNYDMMHSAYHYGPMATQRRERMDRGGDYRDHGDYRDYNDYNDYNDYRRDYGQKLNRQDIEHWISKLMQKIDEKDKEMFKKEKVLKKAEELGVRFEQFEPEEFYVTVLMMYTDYCKTLGNANTDIYIRLAKDWLMDDDVRMKHSEKLAEYYKRLVK